MKIRLISALAIGLLTSACGSSSGVDSTKPLNEVNEAESEKLCEYMVDQMGDLNDASSIQRGICSLQGFAMEQAGLGTCEDVRDACMREDFDVEDEDDFDDDLEEVCDEGGFKISPSCDVTVGEFEDCVRGVRDMLRNSFSGMTCSKLRSDGISGIDWDGEDESGTPFDGVPECEVLTERCEFFE